MSDLTFDYSKEVKLLRERITALEKENEQLRKELNDYRWSETNETNDSWKVVHEMGM